MRQYNTVAKQVGVDLVKTTQELQKESEIIEKEETGQSEEGSEIESQTIEKPSTPQSLF